MGNKIELKLLTLHKTSSNKYIINNILMMN